MQIHQLQPSRVKKAAKRIGRGGKRGTFSGRGSKGQKSRSGTRIRPGFRGGDNPIWKILPKQRGATKKTDIKHAAFQVHYKKPAIIKFVTLEKHFEDGATVTPQLLLEKKLIKNLDHGVKVLGDGTLTKKLTFSEGIAFSKSARDKIH